MQTSLRVILQLAGVLLLAAAVVAFGQVGFSVSDATGPAVLAVLGLLALAIGVRMPRDGLWPRPVSDDQACVGSDDLHRASFLHDRAAASQSCDNAD